MIQKFFITVILLWIQNPKREKVCKEAIAFYFFLQHLKLSCFLPGNNAVEQRWRLSQVRKHLKKIPLLSHDFRNALKNIEEDYAPTNHFVSKDDFQVVSIKRENLRHFQEFLATVTDDNQVMKLRSVMLEEQPRKRKRNLK